MSEIKTFSKRKVGRPRKLNISNEKPLIPEESICMLNPIDASPRRTKRISAQLKEYNIDSEDAAFQQDILESPIKDNITPKGKRGRKPGVSYKKLPIALTQSDCAIDKKPFSTDIMELLEYKVKILGKVDCPICSTYNCPSLPQIIQHMVNCKHEPIVCKLCDGQYESLDAKVEHLISSHNGIEYEIDPKAIDTYRSFVSRGLSKYKIFHCFDRRCPKTYTTIPGLMYHLKSCFPPDGAKQARLVGPATPATGPGSARASKVKAKQNMSSYVREDGSESPKKIKQEKRDGDFVVDPKEEYIREDFHIIERERPTPTKKTYKPRKSGKQKFSGPMPYSHKVLPNWKPDIDKWFSTRLDSSIAAVESCKFYVVDPAEDVFDIEKNEISRGQPVCPQTLRFGQGIRHHGGHSVIGYAGGSVTALSWSPFTQNGLQYFCLCTRLDQGIGTIQIWGMIDPFSKSTSGQGEKLNEETKDNHRFQGAIPCFQYGIVHEFGTVYDAKFCPAFSDSESSHEKPMEFLGHLAFTSSIGPVVIIPLPLPRDLVRSGENKWFETTDVYFLSLYPAVKNVKKESVMESDKIMVKSAVFSQCLNWHLGLESCKIAAGFTDGTIGIWNLTVCSSPVSACWDVACLMPRGEALDKISSRIVDDLALNPARVPWLRPTRVLPAGIGHLREITGLTWCLFDPIGRYLAAVGRDKSHAMWDTLAPNAYGCSGLQPPPISQTLTATYFTGCCWDLDSVNVLAIGDTHASSQSLRVFDNGSVLTEPTKLGSVHHSCHLDISIDPYDSTFAISTAGGVVLAYQDSLKNFNPYSKSRSHRHFPIYQITSSLRPPDDVKDSTKNMASDHNVPATTVDNFKIRLFDDKLYHEEISPNSEAAILTGEQDSQTALKSSPYLLFNDVYQNVPEPKSVSVKQRFHEKLKTTCFEHPFYKDQLYIYKVAWNPFPTSHNWLLSGTGSGFFRLNHLTRLGDTINFYEKVKVGGTKKRKQY